MKRIYTLLMIMMFGAISMQAQAGRWEILRAEYGAGNVWVDVTDQVHSLVRGDSLNIRVDNGTMGVDPLPGTPKSLRLRVRDESGRETVLSFREKDFVGLTVRSRERGWDRLRITRAEYGAEGRFVDVTQLLNSAVRENQLNLPVNNNTMGGDPAQGIHKVLNVWYNFRGSESRVSVNEGDYLSLPGTGEPRSFRPPRGGLHILRADYGADDRYMDVTTRLAARVQGDTLSLRVTNGAMGGDPAEDHHKTLTVWYTNDGRPAQLVVNEGEFLQLPAETGYFSGNLRILRAQYGADFRFFDVTDRLNSLIQGDQLSLRVTNEAMGGDPAPEVHKQLSLTFLFNGQISRTAVDEKDYLNLPSSGNYGGNVPGGALEILKATYGAGERRADVTNVVRANVRGGQLELPVSNRTMGGDPAEGEQKRLKVIYLLQGLRYQTTAIEGDTLVIP